MTRSNPLHVNRPNRTNRSGGPEPAKPPGRFRRVLAALLLAATVSTLGVAAAASPASAAQNGSGSTTSGPLWPSGRVGGAEISLTCGGGRHNLTYDKSVTAPPKYQWGVDQGAWATYTDYLLVWKGGRWQYWTNPATVSAVLRTYHDQMARGSDFASVTVPRGTYVSVMTKVDWKVVYIHEDPFNYWNVTINRTNVPIGSAYYWSSYCKTN